MNGTTSLLHGDCLELLPSIPDGSVDMICADLPYGTTNCAWDVRIPMEPLWAEFWRVAKHNAAICLFAQQPFATDLINAARKWFRYEWVVAKSRASGFANANKMPLRAHELVLVFYRRLPTYRPQKVPGQPYKKRQVNGAFYPVKQRTDTVNCGDRFPTDVIRVPSMRRQSMVSPTQKQVHLLEVLVKSYTNAGELVLDPTMGSGSCGVACVNTGRRFVGMEKDAHFFEVAQGRVAEAERVVAERLPGVEVPV